MESSSIEQFEADLRTVLSSITESIPHNFRLALYGGLAALQEPYRSTAKQLCAEHRLATSNNLRTIQDAVSQLAPEFADPARVSMQMGMNQVRKHGGTVSSDIVRRMLALAGDFIPAKVPPKTTIEDLYEIELEKAQTVHDLDNISNRGVGETQSRREFLLLAHRESRRLAEYTGPLKRTASGDARPNHAYIKRKGLQGATEALAASSAFVSNGAIVVPFLSAWNLVNKWRDSQGDAVIMSNTELPIRNAENYQIILAEVDKPKLFCKGLQTKGLFHPIGPILDAPLTLVVEGWATGLTTFQASGLPVACVGGCDNFLAATAALQEANACSRILWLGDAGANTEAKLRKFHKAIEAFSPTLARQVAWVVVPGSDNTDLNDMADDEGLEHVKAFINDLVERFHELNKPKVQDKFIVSGKEMLADTSQAGYLVKGLLYLASVSLVYGASGTLKSFLLLDLVLHLVTGQDWYERPVKQCKALYVAAEGYGGLRKRVAALLIHLGLLEMPEGLFFAKGAVDIMNTEQLVEVSKFCTDNEIEVIIFDTMHRCSSGDENSNRDAAVALLNIGKHFQEQGVAALFAHHEGHAAKGRTRGASGIPSGADTILHVERGDNGIKVTPQKVKDDEVPAPLTFQIKEQVTNLRDDDGLMSSLVLVPGKVENVVNLPKKQMKLWSALRELGDSFTRNQAERATYSFIETKNKGQTLTQFLTKMQNHNYLDFSDEKYIFCT